MHAHTCIQLIENQALFVSIKYVDISNWIMLPTMGILLSLLMDTQPSGPCKANKYIYIHALLTLQKITLAIGTYLI